MNTRYVAQRAVGHLLPWAEVEPRWRRGLILFLMDGLFIALSAAFIGTFMPLYALGMGATGQQVALLTSLGGVAAIIGCALSGRVVRRLGSDASTFVGRKRATLYFGRVGDSLSLLLVIAIPFFAQGVAAVRALLAVQTMRGVSGSIATPAWAAFVPTIVPLQIRARYISLRSMLQVGVMVVAVPAAGFLITRLGGYPRGYQVSFLISMVLGLIASSFFRRIPLPRDEELIETVSEMAQPSSRAAHWRGPFGRFALAAFLWNVTSAIAAPFYVVYMSETLGLDAGDIGLMASLNTAAQTVGYAVLGRGIDRQGGSRTTAASVLALSVVPLGWLLVSSWQGIVPLQLLSGLASAGYGLGSFSLLLEVTPERDRASYTGAYYTLMSVAATLAPLIGGLVYGRWEFAGAMAVAGVSGLVAAVMYPLVVRGRHGRSGDR